ncbi:MAG: signal recognition particle receptor subunit alpha, partial [Muribaculaceae bacterium]|nr:signal recognition particle receptor subunit alpha [Muribaculaceae bacterium]
MGIFNPFSRNKKETLDKGLERTKQGVFAKLTRAIAGKSKIDDEILDNLEEVFVTSDVGVETTLKIIDRIQARVARDKYVGSEELNDLLCEEISEMLAENDNEDKTGLQADFTLAEGTKRPHVIMVVGVNGVGKTTTIGKLANLIKKRGNKVMLGAADTFRAAAVE